MDVVWMRDYVADESPQLILVLLLLFLLLQQRSLVLIGAIVVHHWSPEVPWHGVAFFCHKYVAIAMGHAHGQQIALLLLDPRTVPHSGRRGVPAIVGDGGLLAPVNNPGNRGGLMAGRVLGNLGGLVAAIRLAHGLRHDALAKHLGTLGSNNHLLGRLNILFFSFLT